MKWSRILTYWLRRRMRSTARQSLFEFTTSKPARELPLRAELLTINEMVLRSKALAEQHKVLRSGTHDTLLSRLKSNEAEIGRAQSLLEANLLDGMAITPAGDWLLDNRHVISEHIQLARRHLPPKYNRSLPTLDNANRRGLPRIFDIVGWVVAHGDARIDVATLDEVLTAYQSVHPLTLGELWAVPIMLRLALVENLRRISTRVQRDAIEQRQARFWAERINTAANQDARAMVVTVADLASSDVIPSRTFVADLIRNLHGVDREAAPAMAWIERWAGEAGTSVEAMLSEESRKQAADQVSVANAIGSLRALSGIDWRDFVEAQSRVETSLRRDPHGTYREMDFTTRDAYRHAIERLSRMSGLEELAVAEIAIELASQHSPEKLEAHVGWYLLDDGRTQLRDRLNAQAVAGMHVRRKPFKRHLGLYLAPIAFLTILGAWFAHELWNGSDAFWISAVVAVFAAIVSSELAIVLTNWVATLTVSPSPLPRMSFEAGIPQRSATLVVVPTMIGNAAAIEGLVDGLESRYLGNRRGAIRFALLTDFPDADSAELDADAGILAQARTAIEALNTRHPWDGVGDRFLLLHRPRLWNPCEGRFMAYERKRGKLSALNALVRGGDGREFSFIAGDITGLDTTRFVITLDTDTQLPRNTASELAGAMSHPLNRAVIDDKRRVVVRGFGLLQPGLGGTMSSRGRSRFARLFGSESGIDPYTRTVSDVYQDLFNEGSFVGKGIYDVDVFERVLAERFPENSVLSHDLLEGNYVHAGLISDVRIYEDHPARYAADIKRRARWIRGDWQLLPWLLPRVPMTGGRWEANPMSWLALGKLTDNLRRSLVPIAAIILLLAGWRWTHAPLAWTASVLALWFLPALLRAVWNVLNVPSHMPYQAHIAETLRDLKNNLWRGIVQVACLAFEAGVHLQAIATTLWRLLVSRRHLLEWDASHEVERKLAKTAHPELRQMLGSTIFSVLAGTWIAQVQPAVLPIAAPVLLAWLFAPALMAWLGDTPPASVETLDAEGIQFAQKLARRTWAFFEDSVDSTNQFLPPDNIQLEPSLRVAYRTSPTNIGLSLLANLSAWDLGFLQTHEVAERVDRTLQTLERMSRFRGHFYNWYDTTNLQPLAPRYVSTVDSGNFAGHMWVLSEGLRALGDAPALNVQSKTGIRITLACLYESLEGGDSKTKEAFESLKASVENDDTENATKAWIDVLVLSLNADKQAEAFRWLERLRSQLNAAEVARTDAGATPDLEALALRAASLAQMDFAFLYDNKKNLLHIGYNCDSHVLDASYYDLLASEARLTVFLAVAMGQLPEDAWFALGRAQTEVGNGGALLSWSGSMFEYLMPDLVMPVYPDTLLDATSRTAVVAQIRYGDDNGVPWGISECGYNAFDTQMNYQYRAFGVPDLAMKRGLGRDLVIAPYAAAMAIMIEPAAAVTNLRRMRELGFAGEYGMHEAVDYTKDRLPRGRDHVVLRSYMAHHQGMALLALSRVLRGPAMQARFSQVPEFRASLLLLQERLPRIGVFHVNDTEGVDTVLSSALEEAPLRVYNDPRQQATVQLLSNGQMHGMYHVSGGGYLRLGDIALNRWRDDPTGECWGQFMYLRDVERAEWWSAAHLPSRARVDRHEAIFSDAKVEYRIERDGIESHLEIVISPEEAAEVRRLHVVNRSRTSRVLEFTTFAEVALGRQAADESHPAFANLFVRTEYIEEKQALICTRRPRSEDESPPVLVHMFALHGADLQATSHETDRAAFIGRTRGVDSPRAMDPDISDLGNTTGAVLDPAVAIRGRVTLRPEQHMVVDVITAAAPDLETAMNIVEKFRDKRMADRAFELAWTQSQIVRRQLGMGEADAALFARLAGLLIQTQIANRGDAAAVRQNRSGQSTLWPQAISGDLPILLLQLSSRENLDLVQRLLRAHGWLRAKGLIVDLVIINQNLSTYRQELQDDIRSLLMMDPEVAGLDRPGGVYVRSQDQLSAEERVLLQAVARVVIDDRRGSLEAQLTRLPPLASMPAALAVVETRAERGALQEADASAGLPLSADAEGDMWPLEAAPEALIFDNGFGGFSPDGREYVIVSRACAPTPMPWCNVLANPDFGCVTSESGTGYTWSGNAHAFRLTPWNNDPVTDAQGEAFYIRDEVSGDYWSPTPLPCRGTGSYRTRHGFGYTVYEHVQAGIASELWVFVDSEHAVKYSLLRLKNVGRDTRRLSAWGYVEWVLGDSAAKNRMHVVTEVDTASGSLFAHNAYHPEFGGHFAFFDMDAARDADANLQRGVSADRMEFIGKVGSLAAPAALKREGLSGRTGVGLDPCAAMQRSFELEAGASIEISFRLGAADSRGAASHLATQTRGVGAALDALDRVRMYWHEVLSTVQVETPDPQLDVMVNGWLPYQIIASRVFARSGFYQSGGAFGFRDQLQDTMASVHALPALSREHLLRSAAHQFSEGDALHWWHPPGDRGVRTRCSDDYIWLPFATARYLEVTGDFTVLDEQVQFVEGRQVRADEEGYYDRPLPTGWTTHLFDHCRRALQRAMGLTGARGLPLMGTGDWNDGMNKVGEHGLGESVWLAFFLHDTLLKFAPTAKRFGDAAFADECETHAASLRANIEKHAWDGDWYLRAWFDDGTPLGSARNSECRIDAISQAWSVLSGAGEPERAKLAMQALSTHLVRAEAGLIQLLDPPFDVIEHDPGYIRGYLPGVRENGGQYTHAAVWAAMAFARLSDRENAWSLARMINPVSHGLDAESVARYKVEPYVIAADVYGVAPHIGRGGWTWYTGSAGWMYRLLLEDLLGVRREGDKLSIKPLLPQDWSGYTVRFRHADTLHEVVVRSSGKTDVEGQSMLLSEDGEIHRFEVEV